MKPRPFNTEVAGIYVAELEHVLEEGEPLRLEAETEDGPVVFTYSVREYGEDEIAVEHPIDELTDQIVEPPGDGDELQYRRKVVVYRDIRPHLDGPVLKDVPQTTEYRLGKDGEHRGSLTRMATLDEVALALTTARDLFKQSAFRPLPVTPAQR